MSGKKGEIKQGPTYSMNSEAGKLYRQIETASQKHPEHKDKKGVASVRFIPEGDQLLQDIVISDMLPSLVMVGDCFYCPRTRQASADFKAKNDKFNSEIKAIEGMILYHLEFHFKQPTYKYSNLLVYKLADNGIEHTLMIGAQHGKSKQKQAGYPPSFWDLFKPLPES